MHLDSSGRFLFNMFESKIVECKSGLFYGR